ncbi:GntR family transcriptional regulator [Salinicola rhizosphaerae]|uniref:GntR family transcriptional regulator n=1 Tax=Salinicola rhizosphaerae TaxID=1443141 RepID=A0ABQ3EAE7_9GAMM|nr:GntR family transcriptional regulator [Salinicola rhizosphaerae]GHB28349.1 GntR family transcriptional regulator [Salinicola rhizosphaerae]
MSRTLKDQLYDALLRSMASGHLEPGLVLLEGNIADIFGMSRSPVRQTLGRLHEEGVISRFEGRGFVVGRAPREVVRRTLSAADFRAAGGRASVTRTESWRELAEQVEHDVVLCSMKGRLELNELQLAKTLGVSRTTTHRILLQLQSLGVVEKVKYSSWNVVPLDADRLHQLYEARRQLEPFMIGLASERAEAAPVERYLERLERARVAYPKVTPNELDALENDLHHEALALGGNTEILIMLQRTRPILLISKHLLGKAIALPPGDPFFAAHRRVFEAMQARRPHEASDALYRHIKESESLVQDRLASFHRAGEIAVPGYLRWLADKRET